MGTRMFSLVKDMLKSVYNLNEMSLSDMLEAAFEMYPVRVVCADIIAPMMWEIGSMWERGEIMIVMEHFASTLLHKQNTTTNIKGPVVIVGCAPDEFHEIGALIVSFFMSLNGWKVVYLGQNVPPTDVMNIVDTMDVHTVALSASGERSLSALKLIGQHIASRAKKKKVEFLVGGRLLKCADGVLESIPAATTRSADDLYSYCPPTHPANQDTMRYSLIRESYRKMRLASERRKRTQYLLDQITDDGAVDGEKPEEIDAALGQELGETLEKTMEELVKMAESGELVSCGGDEDCGPTIVELPVDEAATKDSKKPLLLQDSGEEVKEGKEGKEGEEGKKGNEAKEGREGKEDKEKKERNESKEDSERDTRGKDGKHSDDVKTRSPRSRDEPRKSPETKKSTKEQTQSKLEPKIEPILEPKLDPKSKTKQETGNIDESKTKRENTPTPTANTPPPPKETAKEMLDIKERLEKQRQQMIAMKEMLQRYKDGKKATEQSIVRSRAFLNENRLVSAKKKPAPELSPTLPSLVPPPSQAIPYVPPGDNRLVGPPKNSVPPTTTFHHMHNPAGHPHVMGDNDAQYYPKYTNLPHVGGDTRDSSSSTSMSDDEIFEEGVE